jgi:glyoxylase-like metal-dependent hydrolase (beta-lactamase superfamily II)
MDVIELIPGLHFLRFPVGNAYLWMDAAGLTLVDTGPPGSAGPIAEAIRGLGHDLADVRRVVLTHFHEDHVGSAAEIATWGEVQVLAHRADAPYIRGEATGPLPDLADWERPILERARAQLPDEPPAPVRVDIELEDGDAIGDGGQAIAVPGHTPGSIALYLPDPRVLFTGDTVARSPQGQVMLGVFNADPPLTAASLRSLAELDTEVACFGHGEPVAADAAVRLREAAERLPG